MILNWFTGCKTRFHLFRAAVSNVAFIGAFMVLPMALCFLAWAFFDPDPVWGLSAHIQYVVASLASSMMIMIIYLVELNKRDSSLTYLVSEAIWTSVLWVMWASAWIAHYRNDCDTFPPTSYKDYFKCVRGPFEWALNAIGVFNWFIFILWNIILIAYGVRGNYWKFQVADTQIRWSRKPAIFLASKESESPGPRGHNRTISLRQRMNSDPPQEPNLHVPEGSTVYVVTAPPGGYTLPTWPALDSIGTLV